MKVISQPTKEQLKYVSTINDEALGENTDPDFEIEYIDIGNVDSTGKIYEPVTYRFADAPSRARRIVRHGDVIISTVRTYLQAIAPIESPPANLIVSTGFAVVRPCKDKLYAGFCKYALREPEFLHEVVARSVGISYPAINSSDLGSIPIYLPPLPEQQSIAEYLDRQTIEIDTLIATKQRLLELLAEKRRAFVSYTISYGLTPDVPLCNSGIEWMGEIPEHWRVFRIKHLGKVGNGSTPLRDNNAYWQDGTFPWLTSTVVNNDVVGEPTEFVTEIALRECTLPIIESGSILVAITGEGKTRGKAALLNYKATINQHMAFISPQTNLILPEFLQLYLAGSYEVLRMISEGTGSTKGALTCEQIGEFPVPLPPLSEQREIVSKLNSMKATIDSLGTVITTTIQLLHERRSSLIAAAVSGKLDLSSAS